MLEDLRGLAGFWQDVFEMGALRFVNPHGLTKFFLILQAKKRSASDVFIEIGTYHGVTSRRCAGRFDRVYTVEISPELSQKAAVRFSKLKNRNIHLTEGDGLKVLPEILEKSDVRNALIFLDGHPCGARTGTGAVNEPAVEELAVIARYRDKVNAIIVDDFRNFGVESDFPKKSTLLKQAEDLFGSQGYRIEVRMDQLVILKDA